MALFDKISRGKRLITDPKVFSFEYTPERIVHRDADLETLGRYFFPIFQSSVSANAIITGSVGTGKTVLARTLMSEMEAYARDNGKALYTVLVNSRLKKTDNAVLYSIVKTFQPSFPDRGFSFSEMLNILKKDLQKRSAHLVVALDEADVLLRSGSEIIYTLTRINEDDSSRGTISLLLISQNPILSYLDDASRDTFKNNMVRLAPYDATQLVDILRERVEKGLVPDAITESELSLIGDIASETGSARTAIEILEASARMAESKGLSSIDAECIRSAASMTAQMDNRILELETGPRAALLAIARSIKSTPYTYTGEVEKEYRQLCEELGLKAVGHTQFWNYIKTLKNWGLISTKLGKKGGGNTTMVYLSSISARDLERVLKETFK